MLWIKSEDILIVDSHIEISFAFSDCTNASLCLSADTVDLIGVHIKNNDIGIGGAALFFLVSAASLAVSDALIFASIARSHATLIPAST